MRQCIWNLTDEWTNSLLIYETDLKDMSPYETVLSRYPLLLLLHTYIYTLFVPRGLFRIKVQDNELQLKVNN